MRKLICLIAFATGASIWLAGVHAQSVATLEPSGSYTLDADWAELPVGTEWGAVSWAAADARGWIHAFRREGPIFTFDAMGRFVREWGEGVAKWTHGIRVDHDGYIWVTDGQGHQVKKFSPDGTLLMTLGKYDVAGDGPDTFNRPTDVAVAPNGNFYVSDGYGNSRVAMFAPDGTFMRSWGTRGDGPGQFNLPHSVVIDPRGRVLVADRENDRVQVFDAQGRFIEQWADIGNPYGLAIHDNRVFIADGILNRVAITDLDGTLVDVIEGAQMAHGIDVDRMGNVYVASNRGSSLKKFIYTGTSNEGQASLAQAPAEQVMEEAHRGVFAPDGAESEAARFTETIARELPGGGATGPLVLRNLIDDHIFGRIERDGIPHAGPSSDAEFIRRVYIDATGQLPPVQAVREFIASSDPTKRDKLIDALVGTEAFAEQWAWFWGDLFRLTGRTGRGKNLFHFWNKEWLRVDRPYRDVVHDLLTAVGKSHSMIPALGLIGRNNVGVNNLPDSADDFRVSNRLDSIDEFNVDVARIFLGINTTCVSCHDGEGHLESINLYLAGKTREEFFRQSAFLGRTRMLSAWDDRSKNTGNGDQVIDDLAPGYDTDHDAPFMTASLNRFPRYGGMWSPAFFLTGEGANPDVNPRAELARMLTENIQFGRATVNLVWGRLMTVPFVAPYDGFDLARLDPENPPPLPWTVQPTNPDLLDALAREFMGNDTSVQHLIKTIMKSSAYQLSARFPSEWDEAYTPYYARKYVRLLRGPEIIDAITRATDRPQEYNFGGGRVDRVLALASPSDVGRRGGYGEITSLMQAFFQGNRSAQPPDGNRPSTLQALLMSGSDVVNSRVLAEENSRVQQLLGSDRSDVEIIEELFLATLARTPSPEEAEVALQAFERDRRRGAENVQWALLNGIEFALNH